MESFIVEAQKYYQLERSKRNKKMDILIPKIVVVGVGGSGCNTINRLKNIGVDGVLTVAVNTDIQHLRMIKADKKILFGVSLTRGLGAGGNPEIGRKAA